MIVDELFSLLSANRSKGLRPTEIQVQQRVDDAVEEFNSEIHPFTLDLPSQHRFF